MRVGDPVRLKPESSLRERMQPFADEVGLVVSTFQVDDEELCIAVAFPGQIHSGLMPLSAEDFIIDRSRPGAPF